MRRNERWDEEITSRFLPDVGVEARTLYHLSAKEMEDSRRENTRGKGEQPLEREGSDAKTLPWGRVYIYTALRIFLGRGDR